MTRWALISGPKGTGKSRTTARLATALSARGIAVAGFVQEAMEVDGERQGYRLRRLGKGDERVVARRNSTPRGPREESFCSFVFDNDAFDMARGWLEADAPDAQVLLLDEVSKLEVAGKGHHDAVTAALATGKLVVLSVQAAQLFGVLERFALEAPVASFEIADGDDEDAFVDALVAAARAQAAS